MCNTTTIYDGGAEYSADSAAPSDNDTPAHHQCSTTTIHDGGAEYSADSAAPSDNDTPAHHQCSTTTIHDGGAEYSADSAAPSDDDTPVHRQCSATTIHDGGAEYAADSAAPTGDCSSVNRQRGAATADDRSAEYSADSAAPATDEPGIPSEIQQLATSLREMGQNIAQSSHQNINHLTQATADQARILGHEIQEMVDTTLSDQHQRHLDSTKRAEQYIDAINDQYLGDTQRQGRRIDQVASLIDATEKSLEERLERVQRDIQAHVQTVAWVHRAAQRRADTRPDTSTRKAPPVANYVPRRQPQLTAQTGPNPKQPIGTNPTSNRPARAATRQGIDQPPPDEQPRGALPKEHQNTVRAALSANPTTDKEATPPLTRKELWQVTERVRKMTGIFTPEGTAYDGTKGKHHEEFASFAKRFEYMANYYQIPEANWAHVFATCLATSAHDEYLAMSKEQQNDFSQTVEHLNKIYPAPTRNEWTYRTQWDALRQASNEPLREFIGRIESLAHKAHTSLNPHGLENEKITKFRYGLASSYLRYDLAAVMAETLQELGSRAIAIQMSRDADPATMWAGTTEASEVARDLGTTPISTARSAQFEPQQHPMGEVTRLPYAYPHVMPPATTCVTYVPASSFAVPATPPPPTPSYNPPTQPPPGHPQGSEQRRQQPKDEGYPKKRPGDYQRGMDLASIRCYNCGEPGHLANKCPRPDKRLQRNYHGGNRGRGSRGGNRANSHTDNRQSSDVHTPPVPTPEPQNVPPTEPLPAAQDPTGRQYRAQGVPTNLDLDLSMNDVGFDPLMSGDSRRAMIRSAGADLTSSRSKPPAMHTQALTTEEETEQSEKLSTKQEKAAPPATLPEVPKPFGASAVHGFNPSLIDQNSMTIHPELEESPYSLLDLSASIISKHPLSIACSTRDGYVLWPGVALPAPAAEALYESCKNDQVFDNRQMSLFMSGSLVPVSNLDLEGSLVTDKMLNQLVRSQTNNLRKISLRNCRLLSHEANDLLGSPQVYLPRLEQFDLGNLVCLFKRWADDTSDVRRYMDSVQQGSGPEESPTQPISNGPFSWDYRSITPFQNYVHSDLRASSSLSSPADASAGRFAASPAGYGAALDGNATAVKCSTASVMDRSGSEATAGSVSPDVFHDSQGTSHGEKSLNVFSRSIDRSASLGFVNHITTMCPNLLALTLHGDTFDIVFDSTSHGGTPVRASTFLVMVLDPVCNLLYLDISYWPFFQNLKFLQPLFQLETLILHDVPELANNIDEICAIKTLKRLDLSQADPTAGKYAYPAKTLYKIVARLPLLTCLDIANTNLASHPSEGDETWHTVGRLISQASKQNEALEAYPIMPSLAILEESNQSGESIVASADIINLRGLSQPLEFLGLSGCDGAATFRNIPAMKVAGEGDESQVMTSCEQYLQRPNLIHRVLSEIYRIYRYENPVDCHRALLLVVRAMEIRAVQVSGSAALLRPIIPTNLGLDLLESILVDFVRLFHKRPEFAFLLKEQVCPPVIRLFSPFLKHVPISAHAQGAVQAGPTRVSFPMTMRLLRIVYILTTRCFPLLVTECETFASLLLKFMDADKTPWQRALALEVLHKMTMQPDLLRECCGSHDMRQHSTKILAALCRLSSDGMAVATQNRDPSFFPLHRLLETGLINMPRLTAFWRPMTAHILEVGAVQHAKLRSQGVHALITLVRSAMQYKHEAPAAGDSAEKLEKPKLSPLVALCEVRQEDARVAQMEATLHVIRDHAASNPCLWPDLLHVIGSIAVPGNKFSEVLVQKGFENIQLVVTDFLTYQSAQCLRQVIEVCGKYGSQKTDFNVSLTAIGLPWNISDYLFRNAETIPRPTDASSNDGLWLCLFTCFSELCVDPRPPVRKSASQTLFQTINSHGPLLKDDGWNLVVWQVLFPLLDRVKSLWYAASTARGDSQALGGQNILIHHSRDTESKQWAETRVLTLTGVAKVSATERATRSALVNYEKSWQLLFNCIEESGRADNGEIALASLKAIQDLLGVTKNIQLSSAAMRKSPDDMAMGLTPKEWAVAWKTWLSIAEKTTASSPRMDHLPHHHHEDRRRRSRQTSRSRSPDRHEVNVKVHGNDKKENATAAEKDDEPLDKETLKALKRKEKRSKRKERKRKEHEDDVADEIRRASTSESITSSNDDKNESPQTTRRQNSDPATGSTPPSGILTRQPVKESMNSSISQRLPVSNASSNVPQGNPEPLDKKAKKCWLRSSFIRAFTKSKRTSKQGSIGGSPSDVEEAQRAASVKEAALSNEYAGPSETAPATKDRMEADVPEPNADTTTPQRERSERPPAPSASCVVGQ